MVEKFVSTSLMRILHANTSELEQPQVLVVINIIGAARVGQVEFSLPSLAAKNLLT